MYEWLDNVLWKIHLQVSKRLSYTIKKDFGYFCVDGTYFILYKLLFVPEKTEERNRIFLIITKFDCLAGYFVRYGVKDFVCSQSS